MTMKMTSDMARLHFEAADNFYDIAQVKAQGREENLLRAVEGYQKALEYYTLQRNKTEYARLKESLGNAHLTLAEVRDTAKHLGLAIRAYEEALKVRTSEAFPLDYAETTSNLGGALFMKGELDLALAHFRKVKEVFAQEGIAWAVEKEERNIARVQEEINKKKPPAGSTPEKGEKFKRRG